jgi:hypothetical protein
MKGFSYYTSPLFPGPEYRAVFMNECFELVYHGQGGFTWSDVWNMPVKHRKFNLKKIQEFLDKVQEERDGKNQKLTEKSDFSKLIPQEVAKAAQKRQQDREYIAKAGSKTSTKKP